MKRPISGAKSSGKGVEGKVWTGDKVCFPEREVAVESDIPEAIGGLHAQERHRGNVHTRNPGTADNAVHDR